MFPPSLYLSLVFTWKMRKKPESGWSISCHYFSYHHAFSLHSRKALANQKCRFRMLCGLITRQKLSLVMPGIKSLSRQQKWSLFDDHVQQDRFVCVILHISSWRYGRIVTFFGCINDDCNLFVGVCDFASQETCLHDYLCAVQFFVWFTYSLASMKKNKPTGVG
jgi:hypothetical protein